MSKRAGLRKRLVVTTLALAGAALVGAAIAAAVGQTNLVAQLRDQALRARTSHAQGHVVIGTRLAGTPDVRRVLQMREERRARVLRVGVPSRLGRPTVGKPGPRGPRGPRGPAGPAGPTGGFDPTKIVARAGPQTVIPAASVMGDLSVGCAPGEIALSGGYFSDSGFAYADRPSNTVTGWIVLIDNFDSPIAGMGQGFVICGHP